MSPLFNTPDSDPRLVQRSSDRGRVYSFPIDLRTQLAVSTWRVEPFVLIPHNFQTHKHRMACGAEG